MEQSGPPALSLADFERLTSEPGAGSHVAPKVPMKLQSKQQRAAESVTNEELAQVLKRWGLISASYLAKSGHKRAISILVENPGIAATLIDATMKRAAWSADAGVGSRVDFLRENVADALATHLNAEDAKLRREADAMRRAKDVASRLPDFAYDGDFDPSRVPSLIERGINRLGESEAVSSILRTDSNVRRRLLNEELVRESSEREVGRMSDAEFAQHCERLFASEPGLRRLFDPPNRESVGLRLRLVTFLLEQEGKKGRGRFGNRACGVSEHDGPLEQRERP